MKGLITQVINNLIRLIPAYVRLCDICKDAAVLMSIYSHSIGSVCILSTLRLFLTRQSAFAMGKTALIKHNCIAK